MRPFAAVLIAVALLAPTSQAQASGTLHVSRDLLVHTRAFPTESCCRWIAARVFHDFRGDTDDPCAKSKSLAPRVRHGVVSRLFRYGGITDEISLAAARSTIVRLPGRAAAHRWMHRYVRHGFGCPPRTIDGSSPGSATAVYDVVRRAAHRTVIAEKLTDVGATTMRRYFDIRRVRAHVAIVEYDLGEEIAYRPDLRREDQIADAQQRRLRHTTAP